MRVISKLLDSELVRSLPDLEYRGWGIVRVGWNFKPDWDRSLHQPSFGRWWVWCGPYLIGRPDDWGEQDM